MNPTQEYGYVLIPPDQHAQFLPLRYDDECWFEPSQRWERTLNSPGQGFSAGMTYRRKIDAGDGWEIIPESEIDHIVFPNMEYEHTFDGGDWWETCHQSSLVGRPSGTDKALAFRRCIQPKSGWVEMKTKKPMVGQKVWFYGEVFGIIMAEYIGGFTTVTHWRPVNPGEIPEPPKVEPVKSQAELDSEAADAWIKAGGSHAYWGLHPLMRTAYIAGLRDGRAK